VQDSLVAFNYVIENVLKRGEDHVHLLHVVPDLFTSPASGSIHYCSSPDPETERALVGGWVGAAASSPAAQQPTRDWPRSSPAV
jgi:hypothetical protein